MIYLTTRQLKLKSLVLKMVSLFVTTTVVQYDNTWQPEDLMKLGQPQRPVETYNTGETTYKAKWSVNHQVVGKLGNPVRMLSVTCSCITTNMDGNQQLALFIYSDICAEKA